jgi:hypothetical protein
MTTMSPDGGGAVFVVAQPIANAPATTAQCGAPLRSKQLTIA